MFVGNLPSDANERDLERFFRGYGRMREVLLKNGYGFVEFDDRRDAEDAVYELNGKKLLGVRVTVEKAKGTPRGRDQYSSRDRDYPSRDYRGRNDRYGPPTRTAYRLIVENLSSRVSWQDLKDYMRQAGEVTYADAHKKHRNEGVVEFASSADMKNALDTLDNSEINGRKIKLVEDKRQSSRSSSYSSRSRSRSPARKSRSSSRSRSPKKSKSRSASRKKSVERRERSRSNSRNNKEERRSRSPERRSHSRPKSEERRSRSKSKSRSPRRDERDERSRSRSRSADRTRNEKSRSKSRSRSPSRSRSRSPSRSRSRSRD